VKDTIRKIQLEVGEAVALVLNKHGYRTEKSGATYEPDGSRFNLRIAVVRIGAETDVARREWEDSCWLHGLKPEHFGATVRVNGMTGTICGIKSRAQKFPILVKAPNGKTYKVAAEDVALRLGLPAPEPPWSDFPNAAVRGNK
jgi:hypothetical protein